MGELVQRAGTAVGEPCEDVVVVVSPGLTSTVSEVICRGSGRGALIMAWIMKTMVQLWLLWITSMDNHHDHHDHDMDNHSWAMATRMHSL